MRKALYKLKWYTSISDSGVLMEVAYGFLNDGKPTMVSFPGEEKP